MARSSVPFHLKFWGSCYMFLWPDSNIPAPICWEDHTPMSTMKFDRCLDETLYWELDALLDKVKLGVD